ncbi:MAG: polysaccharide pyruvyl transferase family protein, partial [Desulfoferrobacter sp.]
PEGDPEIKQLLIKHGLKPKQFVVLSLRELLDKNRQNNAVDELAGALTHFLAEQGNMPILFVPFQNMISDYPVTDTNMVRLLIQKLGPEHRDKVVIWEDELNPQRALNLIGNACFGIGMRYHFLLFCILNEIPVISISYDTKCVNLMNDAGFSDLSFDVSEIEAGSISAKMLTVFDSYDNYRGIACAAKRQLCTRASRSFELLKGLLREFSTAPGEQHSPRALSGGRSQLNPMLYIDSDINKLLDHLSQQTATIQELRDDLKNKIDSITQSLGQENNRLKEAIQELQNELKEKIISLQEQASTILELEQEKDHRRQTAEELQRETASLKHELNAIHASKTWRLGQLYGKIVSLSPSNRFIENVRKKFLPLGNSRNKCFEDSSLHDEASIRDKLNSLARQIHDRAGNDLFIITSTFPFDEFYNQRAINFSKFLSARGCCVLYIAWRWSKSEPIKGNCEEVYPNIFQVPVDYFLEHTETIIGFPHSNKWLIVEFPHPRFYPIMLQMQGLGYKVLYDIIDDWEEFYRVGQASWFQDEIEKAILLKVDAVTAVSPALIEKFADLRADIKLVRNGFSQGLLGGKPDGGAADTGTDTVIGYFGHLTESWFDWDFISQIADARGDFSFEIIGYGESPFTREKISRFKNIHLIGKVHPSSLNQHVRNWDVAIIPFMDGPLSESVDPIKIYEYLYFGLPVVVKGISHLSSFPYVKVCQD